MKSQRSIVFTVCILLGSVCRSQNSHAQVESISFAQGFAGMRSTILLIAEDYVRSGKLIELTKMIDSRNVPEKFVGAIVCNHLEKKNKIVLSERQKKKIKEIQLSKERLSFNSGCTCQKIISLSEYFEGQNPCNFGSSILEWLKMLEMIDH